MSKRPSILFVDDEQINLMLFDVCFRDKYSIFLAQSGDEGLKLLDEKNDINFVFSDMKMPGMNGIEFISEAKNKYPQINYYILTGFGLTDSILKALDDGLIKKCLYKPFNIEDIEVVVDAEV